MTNPERVAKHAFWPVILNPRRVLSLKADENGNRRRSEKRRPIVFAAHSDSHVYAYYAFDIGKRLEAIYEREGGDHVLAYRRFDPPQCNVHFAKSAFDEVAQAPPRDFIAMDVEGFFDSLDHEVLKSAWCRLLGEERLPADHYAVFRACTHDAAVTVPMLRDLLGGEIRRRRGKGNEPICTPEQFRKLVKPALRPRHELVWETKKKDRPALTSNGPVGIPQGLPISAVLANLYMLETDQNIAQRIAGIGGSYRRYSDDLLVIVPSRRGSEAEDIVIEELEKVRLTANKDKFDRCRFRMHGTKLASFSIDKKGEETGVSPASYLGLSFDGTEIRVRPSTVSRFMIKARRAVRSAEISARKNGETKLKRRKLYARLTTLGYGTAYGRTASLGEPPPGAPRLGFFKYLSLVYRVTASEAIRKQREQLKNEVFRLINQTDARLRMSAGSPTAPHSTAQPQPRDTSRRAAT